MPDPTNTRARTALLLAVLGAVIALGGFIPMVWISLVLATVGGLLLLAGLILGIIALTSRTEGGDGMSIAAIVVALAGGVAAAFAVAASILWIGLAAADDPAPPPTTPAATATADPGEDGDAASGEQAYLAEVKPAVLAILQTIEPSITAEQLSQLYPDDALIASGRQLATIPADQRAAQREAFVRASVESSNGALTDQTAGELFDVLITAADRHLVN